jgi:hypothetical protein
MKIELEDLKKKEVRHQVYVKTLDYYVKDKSKRLICLCDVFVKVLLQDFSLLIYNSQIIYYLPEFLAKKPPNEHILNWWWTIDEDLGRSIRTEILKQLIEETK